MPELPEVETLRRQLQPILVGSTVVSVVCSHPRYSVPDLKGAGIVGLRRRGKYLLFDLDAGGTLLIHLGMAGQLLWGTRPNNHVHFELVTSRGTLFMRDARRFGMVRLLQPGDELPQTLRNLGQEPGVHLDVERAARRLARGGAPLKARLLEQRAVAGVGNYLADEALHAAKLHPGATSLSVARARTLVLELNRIIMASTTAGGVSERDYLHIDGGRGSYKSHLRCYGRAGQPCLRCGGTLRKTVVVGRGSTFCSRCQRATRRT